MWWEMPVRRDVCVDDVCERRQKCRGNSLQEI